MAQLQGQVALVTGASSGIGRATALALASAGMYVFAGARRFELLEQLAAEASARGLRIVPLRLDVSDDGSIAEAAAAVFRDTSGYGLDILVNNAGFGQMGPLEEVPIEKLRRQLETNLVGPLALTQHFLSPMRERRHGRVINVSSLAGRVAFPYGGAYAASKFGLEAASDALRWELARWNVRVVLIEPGPIASEFGAVVERRLVHPPQAPSAYPLAYRVMGSWDEGTRTTGLPAALVARAILRAARSPRPAARYVVPGVAGPFIALAGLLPACVVDPFWALARRYLERQMGVSPANSSTARPSASSQAK
jgi:NAD(P)-dependent dehydrogenase (short-subunit alcohol dehydrogenase family)